MALNALVDSFCHSQKKCESVGLKGLSCTKWDWTLNCRRFSVAGLAVFVFLCLICHYNSAGGIVFLGSSSVHVWIPPKRLWTHYLINRLGRVHQIYELSCTLHLVTKMNRLDFEVKSWKVSVMTRPDIVIRGGGIQADGSPFSLVSFLSEYHKLWILKE